MSQYDNQPQPQKSEADSVAAIVSRNLADVATLNHNHGLPVSVLVHPPGSRRELTSLERYLPVPLRKRANLTLRDHPSFIDYVLRHREPGTIVLVHMDETGGSFTAIVDYHQPHGDSEIVNPTADAPRWGDHVCKYVCEHTPEWKRWMAKSGKPMTQTDMALFIEDNMFDIVTPESARMLEMVKTLEATQGAQFKSGIRLDNGDRSFTYVNQTTAKAGQSGEIEIPERFELNIPVFTNGPAYKVACRFRYRIEDGGLAMGYEVERPHKIIELALTEARDAIVKMLHGTPVLFGTATLPPPAA